jgi:hypothetical protein
MYATYAQRQLYLCLIQLSQNCHDRHWGPPSCLFNGYSGSFPGVKQPEGEGDHSPPTSAEVQNEWSYTSAHPYAFMARTGTNLLYCFTSVVENLGHTYLTKTPLEI